VEKRGKAREEGWARFIGAEGVEKGQGIVGIYTVARRYYGEIPGRDFLWRKKKLTAGEGGGRRTASGREGVGPRADSSTGPKRFPRALFAIFPFLFVFSFLFSFVNFANQFQIGFKQPLEICKLIPSVC
jgi:hypothetical protein